MGRNIDIANYNDVLDVRDIIARVEELEALDSIDAQIDNLEQSDEATELVGLRELLGDLCGNGGDEQWKGDWYPVTLVRDSHFQEYAQELAEDCCPYPTNSPERKTLDQWPYRCIDWEQAARELRMDYSSVEYDGVTYWYR